LDPYGEYETSVHTTLHGAIRARRQNLMPEDLNYVLAYGWEHRAAGACFCSLRAKDMPVEDRRLATLRRLIGTTLVLSPGESSVVITCYREAAGGLVSLRKKCRYDRKAVARQHRREAERLRQRFEMSLSAPPDYDVMAVPSAA